MTGGGAWRDRQQLPPVHLGRPSAKALLGSGTEHAKRPKTSRIRANFFTENSFQRSDFRANLLRESAEKEEAFNLFRVRKMEQNLWV